MDFSFPFHLFVSIFQSHQSYPEEGGLCCGALVMFSWYNYIIESNMIMSLIVSTTEVGSSTMTVCLVLFSLRLPEKFLVVGDEVLFHALPAYPPPSGAL